MKKIDLAGRTVYYEQIRSGRKSISATAKDGGSVVVRTPYNIGDSDVREFLKRNANGIARILDKRRIRDEYENNMTAGDMERMRSLAESVIPERVRCFSEKMGVKPKCVKINGAKKRFGSCSSSGSLNFSYRIMGYSANAVDYVVVHELAHLIHMNHSAAFWAVVEKYMPEYMEARRELKSPPARSGVE